MKKVIIAIIVILLIVGGYYWYRGNRAESDFALPDTFNEVGVPITSGDEPLPGSAVHDLPVEPAAARAREVLAEKLSVATSTILILKVEEKEWPDGCLGLAGIDEMCTQAIVPGFLVEMKTKTKIYFYRTDKDGLVTVEQEDN